MQHQVVSELLIFLEMSQVWDCAFQISRNSKHVKHERSVVDHERSVVDHYILYIALKLEIAFFYWG